MTVFQGDFGKGIPTGSGIWSDPGANPCIAYGPLPVAGVTPTGSGLIFPNFRVGMTINGSEGTEFVLCKLVLAGTTDLLPGQAYFWDAQFTAILFSATNGNNTLSTECGILNVFAPNLAAGTYWVWMQRAGHASVMALAASVATGAAETTATAGSVKFPAVATPTAGQKSAGPCTAFVASSGVTFTGNTTNGSPYITNVVSAMTGGGITDLQLGQTITGTNLPANACVAAIDKLGGQWRIAIGTGTATNYAVLQNATGTAAATTFTVTSHVTANVFWPTLNKQN
jgi:hypothetical protein